MSLRADLLILDGRHLLWRCCDVHPDLSANVDGKDIATGGMYGFLHVVLRIHARYGGEVIVAWEGQGRREDGKPSPRNFRFDLYPAYKSKDEEMPVDRMEFISEMSEQETRLKGILSTIGVKQYMGIACEGDDVVGRTTLEAREAGKLVVIYSGDSDLRQLVKDGFVYVVAPDNRNGKVVDRVYTEAEVFAKHGVRPEQMAALKAIVGGKDNLPGVRGVGKKYGAILVNHYGTLTNVLRAAVSEADDWPLTPRVRGLVAAAFKDVLMYYKIAKVRCDIDMESIEPMRSQRGLLDLLRLYKFRSLAAPAELGGLMNLGRAG